MWALEYSNNKYTTIYMIHTQTWSREKKGKNNLRTTWLQAPCLAVPSDCLHTSGCPRTCPRHEWHEGSNMYDLFAWPQT